MAFGVPKTLWDIVVAKYPIAMMELFGTGADNSMPDRPSIAVLPITNMSGDQE